MTIMKEGVSISFNAPIINNGGTINGDIVNPVFNFGSQEMNETDKRKLALECMEARIKEEIAKPNKSWRKVLTPLVAAIRQGLVPNNMTCDEFNKQYGVNISPATFSTYVPKNINDSEIFESDTEAFEKEFLCIFKA